MRTNAIARLAAVLVVLEGLALGVIVVRQIAALAAGDTESFDSAIALVVLTLIGAIALVAFGTAVWRGQSWGRSGGIVAQALILAVAVGAATGVYGHPLTGLALALPAIVVIALLVMASRRRADASSDEPPASVE